MVLLCQKQLWVLKEDQSRKKGMIQLQPSFTIFFRFECKICLNPDEKHNADAIEWDWAKVESKGLTPIEYTEHMLLSPDDQSLKIYNLQQENTGQYICRLGDALTAPYFLTVANSSINMSVVSRTISQIIRIMYMQ